MGISGLAAPMSLNEASGRCLKDFVAVVDRLPVRECRLVGRMPMHIPHHLAVAEISLGGARPA